MDLSIDQALDLAIQYHQQGKLNEAKSIYEAILKSSPQNHHALNLLGVIHLSEGHIDSAIQLISKSLKIEPNNPRALVNLGLAHDTKNNIKTAQELYQLALQLDANMPEAILNLGGCYFNNKQYDLAQSQYERLLKLSPNHSDALNNLGKIAENKGATGVAEKYYRRAVKHYPKNSTALVNLGHLLVQEGKFEKALPYLNKAIEANPYSALAHYNRATVLLRLGQFKQGWYDYEWRIMNRAGRRYLLNPATRAQLPAPSTLMPIELEGKKIWFLGDQGIGDELFFLRFIDRLKSSGAIPFVSISEKLEPLVKRWGHVILSSENSSDTAIDYIFSLGDLPLITGMSCHSEIPGSIQMSPLQNKIDQVNQDLAKMPRPWLAITWEGGTRNDERQLHKHIPLEQLLNSISQWHGSVLIVQREPNNEDIEAVKSMFGNRMCDCSEMNNDLEYALALLNQIDRYIGVSNTNMHLLAMTNGTADVLVPLESEFRWMAKGDKTPWFPDFNLYRQSSDHTWNTALKQLNKKLLNS
ncbi:TPR repeat-containing protein [Oleiphilus messinensis]|uniref:TPR repeat-containing protein n=1 Tax=Oleiphilus messinensis TaxID=141451 RepID=A0A1Y0IAG1_9GAMM|nr:tetratricopeptide repeat protein [Oleiphilus messinensis]ARU57149.1 TPR repeat-containing protein [Oleiphilus messinensis]